MIISVCVQSFSVECGICYSYHLEAAIPDQVCNDPRCGQPFHQACLYEVRAHTYTHSAGLCMWVAKTFTQIHIGHIGLNGFLSGVGRNC